MRRVRVRASALRLFEQMLTSRERKTISTMKDPVRIQEFLDSIPYSTDDFYRCPLRVLRDRVAHCFDGALFAAAALRLIGFPPLVIDMLPNDWDDEHLLAVFKLDDHWGAVGKSNFVGLRYREPIHRSLRELVISYFEQYYNVEREKTLRAYTRPLNLTRFDDLNWMTRDEHLEKVAKRLGEIQTIPVLTKAIIARLSLLDKRSYDAGLFGANPAGLFEPRSKAKGERQTATPVPSPHP
jgi:hypothetical protein